MPGTEFSAFAWLERGWFDGGWPAQDWLARSWLLVLAFTFATLCVAALRPTCRCVFGAERAFQLWLLPPLAMLASQLPHAASGAGLALPHLIFVITSAGNGWPVHASSRAGTDLTSGVALIWLAGAAASLALAGWRQRRYGARLRGAVRIGHPSARWPVLRAATSDVGPALVGAWRPRIVLPADFDSRYDATERTLILAHETMHARRGDGCWCLVAQVLAGLLWFHPLARWAFSALRRDQELACDAAVVREHADHRRNYAHAMLKTQSAALVLPVGCRWSPRHPLTERIAMLKLPSPSRQRRQAGILAGCALLIALTGVVYAASAPPGRHPTSPTVDSGAGRQYQLDMKIEFATGDAQHRHTERARVALCAAPGDAASVRTHGWEFRTVTGPAAGGRVRIDLTVMVVADSKPFAHAQLQGKLGEPLHAQGQAADGQHRYVAAITAQPGCPARRADPAAVMVSEHVERGTARAVAASVASKAGWVLVDPEVLSSAPISLNFDSIPATEAMRLVANVAGAKVRFEGRSVHFEPR